VSYLGECLNLKGQVNYTALAQPLIYKNITFSLTGAQGFLQEMSR